jgi:hypothetical protein
VHPRLHLECPPFQLPIRNVVTRFHLCLRMSAIAQPATLNPSSGPSFSAVHHATDDTKPPAVGWTMPSITEARSVLPDREYGSQPRASIYWLN